MKESGVGDLHEKKTQPHNLKMATVVGRRVFLRPPARSDLREFIALSRASTSFHRGLGSPPAQPKQFLEYLERCRRPDSAHFLICLTADGAIAGTINLSQIFRGGFQNAYLGYYMGAPYAGRGYMTEAVGLLLRYAFSELKLHRLEANIQPGNSASIALVRRAGFSREGFSRRYLKICGRWRDHERWAIIAEDWKATLKRAG
jgi:ribosomal-protein-alanine N-acetyltransferase